MSLFKIAATTIPCGISHLLVWSMYLEVALFLFIQIKPQPAEICVVNGSELKLPFLELQDLYI